MRYLLDSNILIWTLSDTLKLKEKTRDILLDRNTEVYISQISLMEYTIKINIGKLKYGSGIEELLGDIYRLELEILPLKNQDFIEYNRLELHHRDPFDRFLIAQAKSNDLTIITSDVVFSNYDINTIIN